MTQDPALSAKDPQQPQEFYHNDLSGLPLGSFPFLPTESTAIAPEYGGLYVPVSHPSWSGGCFKVIQRGLGKYIETVGPSPEFDNRLLITGDEKWQDYRLRAVVTPLSFDDCSPNGGRCGVVARFADPRNYIALVLDQNWQVKLIERTDDAITTLDAKPLEFCLGQSLTLTLAVSGGQIRGTAGPYSGATHVSGVAKSAQTTGKVGFVSDISARFGPFTVESLN
jgi:hypothetical protein